MAATVGNGLFTFVVMFGRACGRSFDLWPASHGCGRLLRDPRRTRRRFRDFDFWPIPASPNRRRGISAINRDVRRETRSRGILRRTNNGGWLPGVDPERIDGFFATRRLDC